MDAPHVAADLLADPLPPELSGLVTLHEDGELSWTRTVPTPYLPLGVAALGVPALGVFHGLVTLLASSTLGREPPILPIVVACVALVVLAHRYLSEHVERVRVGVDGISGRHGLRWAEGDTLHLAGDLRDSTAWLEHHTAGGKRTRLHAWTEVKAYRERGWDVDSIRWFAERIAALAGVPLHDALQDDARWANRDAERVAIRHAHARRMTPKFASYVERPPQTPETTWGLDGVEILPGRGARVWVGANTLITQGGRRIPLHEIVEVFPWFGEIGRGKTYQRLGEVRALTRDGFTHLLRFDLQEDDVGRVLGAAASIREAVERAGAQRLSGSSEDVPDALKRLAARTLETR